LSYYPLGYANYYPYYALGYANYYPWFIPSPYYGYDYQQAYAYCYPYPWYNSLGYGYCQQPTSYYPYPYQFGQPYNTGFMSPYEQANYPFYPALPPAYSNPYKALPMLPSY